MRILQSLGVGRRLEQDTCLEATVDWSVSGTFRLLQGAYFSNAPRGWRGRLGVHTFRMHPEKGGGVRVHTFRMHLVGGRGGGGGGPQGAHFSYAP